MEREQYRNTLVRLFTAIERTLPDQISLDDLAKEAYLSKYHLHRVFKTLCGVPLAEYVRRRRLTNSLASLSDSGKTILAIALESGFGHEQSYIRAFRTLWGITPGEYRERKTLLPATPAISPEQLISVGQDNALISPGCVARPDLHLCGLRYFIRDDENAAENTAAARAKSFLGDCVPRIPVPVYTDRYVGYIEHCDNANDNWYMTCAELRKKPGPQETEKLTEEGFEYRHIQKQLYREFLCISRIHPSQLLWEDVVSIYHTIFYDWIPANSEIVEPGWHIEYVDFTTAREDYSEFRVLVPVSTATKIVETKERV